MILFAILTGIVIVYVWRKHASWSDLLILPCWGILLAATPLGATVASWLASLNTVLATHL